MSKNTWTHRVKNVKPRTRISDYCGKVFELLGSKSAAKKALSAGRIKINGRVASTADFLKAGDNLELTGTGIHQAKAFDVDMEIVYEDDWLLVVNKPGGIAVNGNRFKTVENGVVGKFTPSKQSDALPRPIAVHRIDVPTKGLVMLAKTKKALINLGKSFQESKVKKEYIAIAHGKLDNEGSIDAPIQGKSSVTKYETIKVVPSRIFGHLSLLRLTPITGRTHQLRLHLKDKGHFIVGDKMYADDQRTILGKGLFLCSTLLAFPHPASGKAVEIRIDAPARFEKTMQREADRF